MTPSTNGQVRPHKRYGLYAPIESCMIECTGLSIVTVVSKNLTSGMIWIPMRIRVSAEARDSQFLLRRITWQLSKTHRHIVYVISISHTAVSPPRVATDGIEHEASASNGTQVRSMERVKKYICSSIDHVMPCHAVSGRPKMKHYS